MVLDARRRLRDVDLWEIKESHKCSRKSGYVLHIPSIKIIPSTDGSSGGIVVLAVWETSCTIIFSNCIFL